MARAEFAIRQQSPSASDRLFFTRMKRHRNHHSAAPLIASLAPTDLAENAKALHPLHITSVSLSRLLSCVDEQGAEMPKSCSLGSGGRSFSPARESIKKHHPPAMDRTRIFSLLTGLILQRLVSSLLHDRSLLFDPGISMPFIRLPELIDTRSLDQISGRLCAVRPW